MQKAYSSNLPSFSFQQRKVKGRDFPILKLASDWSMVWKGICSSSQQSVVGEVKTTANSHCDGVYYYQYYVSLWTFDLFCLLQKI